MIKTPKYEQLTFLEFLSDSETPITEKVAISCFDNKKEIAKPVEEWMKEMFPKCTYYILIDNRVFALKRTKYTTIPKGYEYLHYFIDEEVYEGTFLGGIV